MYNTGTKKERLWCLKKAGENICHILAAVSGTGNEIFFWSNSDGCICSRPYSNYNLALSTVIVYTSKNCEDG